MAATEQVNVSELAKRLRERMVSEHISLLEATKREGLAYNPTYHLLRKNGWLVRQTLVFRPRIREAK